MLLEDYQRRLDQHELEGADTAAKVRSIEVDQLELERLQTASANKDVQISELQHRLSSVDAEVYRQNMLAVEARGRLERTQIELEAKTQDLESLLKREPPILQAAKFYRDCRPECVTAAKLTLTTQTDATLHRQSKVVYLPYARTEQLLRLVQSLSSEVCGASWLIAQVP